MNLELDTGNGSLVESQKCSRHIGFKGNPFLYDGCEVIEDCARCPYSSSCNYDIIYGGDWSSTKVINFTCGPNLSPTRFGSKLSVGVILDQPTISSFSHLSLPIEAIFWSGGGQLSFSFATRLNTYRPLPILLRSVSDRGCWWTIDYQEDEVARVNGIVDVYASSPHNSNTV
ncbi:hypothetical protein L1987_37287 [Smallanthus sonchifolius]|uniref:Uncharacterized protein n=1 Tax=Smallanthus sonchifolius TaxID=185202 RepID=A0ACB9HFS4_9ASTR|nr:hypothetical protein L1987_37287 [Smallanthus sonchifolius]